MRVQILAVATICLIAGGCSTTHQVQRERAGTWLQDAQSHLLQNSVTVSTRDGSTFSGEMVALETDRLMVALEDDANKVSLPLDSVTAIRRPGNGGAVVGGLLGGILLGGLVGGTIGSSAGVDDGLFGALSGGIEGIGVGLMLGGAVGAGVVGEATRTHDYIISHGRTASAPPPDTSKQISR